MRRSAASQALKNSRKAGEAARKNWARSSSPSGPSASSAGTTLAVKGAPARRRAASPGSLSRICAPSPLGRRRLPRDRRSLCWVIVEGIPRLSSQQRNEARRFNILIDALYEARTLLIASADVLPEKIYKCRRRHLRVPAHSLAPDRDAGRGGTSLTVRGGEIMVPETLDIDRRGYPYGSACRVGSDSRAAE